MTEFSIGPDGCSLGESLCFRGIVIGLRGVLSTTMSNSYGSEKIRRQRPGSSSRRSGFSRRDGERRSPMTGLKMLVAAALMSTVSISTISASSAAEGGPSDFQARYPDRDVLTGELTPAGKLGLELPGGAAPSRAVIGAYGSIGSPAPSILVQPSRPRRHRSEHLPRR